MLRRAPAFTRAVAAHGDGFLLAVMARLPGPHPTDDLPVL
ncbi:hypothetical protein A7982_13328 [Minicystis rosea]|nr:hypothetical protein A7982_13328 [Minicystis rosea]